MNKYIILALIILIPAVPLSAGPPGQNASDQNAGERRWIAPLYAFDKNGAPATGLTAADLEISLNGVGVDHFRLEKGGSSGKIVFIVFDAASQPYNILSKSKKIAEAVVSHDKNRAQFVVMTIDPNSGLKVVFGPSGDGQQAARAINKSVIAKKSDSFRSRADAGTEIRDVYPRGWNYDSRQMQHAVERDKDLKADKQTAAVIISSLETLNVILGRFPGSGKIVHLYSSGVPIEAAENRSQFIFEEGSVEVSSPDKVLYDQIGGIGQKLKKNGAVVFLINPAGMRIDKANAASGEQTLHLLVRESGGRYFSGADKDISRALTAMEQGYYEISFSGFPDVSGTEAALVVRPINPDITVNSVANLVRRRSLSETTPLERQALVSSILTGGIVGDIDLKISHVPAEITPGSGTVYLSVPLPPELARSEWTIYRVWRKAAGNDVQIETENVVGAGPNLAFSMAAKPDFVHDAVLVHAKTGTVLICRAKTKDGPKK